MKILFTAHKDYFLVLAMTAVRPKVAWLQPHRCEHGRSVNAGREKQPEDICFYFTLNHQSLSSFLHFCLTPFRPLPAFQERAAGALANLAADDGCSSAIVEAQGVQATVRLLASNHLDVVQEQVGRMK